MRHHLMCAFTVSRTALLDPWRQALYDFDIAALRAARERCFMSDALVQLGAPFETLDGPADLVQSVLVPLAASFPDLERRDTIVLGGRASSGTDWIGCCGYWTGTFSKSWLGIPATGRVAAMRFHEFYRVVGDRVVEVQAVWDIPELMMQAGVWPLSPSLGREWHVPGPATQDGLSVRVEDALRDNASLKLVSDMLQGLGRFAEGGTAAMQLERYWHPGFSWYGPSGIGTTRGIDGFRSAHQIPFLNALPDRVVSGEVRHLFAEGDYVAFTGWPGMQMTVSGDGWLGIAPANQRITMRSLDFWRCESGLIRENWVLIDLLDVYRQLGVDVFARLRELARFRGS